MLHALQLQHEAWAISAQAHWRSTQDSKHIMRRGFCTFVPFHFTSVVVLTH